MKQFIIILNVSSSMKEPHTHVCFKPVPMMSTGNIFQTRFFIIVRGTSCKIFEKGVISVDQTGHGFSKSTYWVDHEKVWYTFWNWCIWRNQPFLAKIRRFRDFLISREPQVVWTCTTPHFIWKGQLSIRVLYNICF